MTRSGAVDTPEGWDDIQNDLDKLKKWVHGNFIVFNKTWVKVTPNINTVDGGIKSNPAEKDMGVLVDERLNTS
ncbi:rna-directed dna polymerase from mobile element jockey-like [Pitangus sulphuratus]|nr:rna-directed dna polymerase from mobile element jockey-like [Pitangus sulphuratus]